MTATIPGTPTESACRIIQADGDTVVLGLLGTDYQLHLVTTEPVPADPGDLVRGTIHATARRVDPVGKGGRFIEPVYGRPRRIQGRVSHIDTQTNRITVDCGCRFVCDLTRPQRANAFPVGTLVGFDVEPGATFHPADANPDTPPSHEPRQ